MEKPQDVAYQPGSEEHVRPPTLGPRKEDYEARDAIILFAPTSVYLPESDSGFPKERPSSCVAPACRGRAPRGPLGRALVRAWVGAAGAAGGHGARLRSPTVGRGAVRKRTACHGHQNEMHW